MLLGFGRAGSSRLRGLVSRCGELRGLVSSCGELRGLVSSCGERGLHSSCDVQAPRGGGLSVLRSMGSGALRLQ